LQVIENIVTWNIFVRDVKQVYNQSHCILFNFLLLVQIPEAKLDYIKSRERAIEPSLFFDVSKVWFEELIKFRQDLMLEHYISKLFLLFLGRIFIRFKKKLPKAWRTSFEELRIAISSNLSCMRSCFSSFELFTL